jgi:hypothetical protein
MRHKGRGVTPEQQLAKYLELVDKLPSAPPPVLFPSDDPLRMLCLCGHFKMRSDMPVRSTGLVNFRDTVCKGCSNKDSATWSTLVCHRCKTVVGKVEPMRDKDGFVFARGRCYHTARCLACCPDLTQTEIVERVLWRKNNLR